MPRSRGFTLIEVMITVAIVAILAAIAIPSYSEYVRRGRVTEAVSMLSGMRVKMEQYFQDNRVYNGTPPACASTSIAPLPTGQYFDFTCTPLAATYTIVATGKVGTSLEGFQYSITETNARATAMTAPSNWPSNATCWVLRKDGSC